MARLKEGTLGDFTATGAGSAVDISELESVRTYVVGTFTGTVAIQISFDSGTTWVNWDTSTATELQSELPPCGRVRANVTTLSGGSVKVRYGGRDTDRLE